MLNVTAHMIDSRLTFFKELIELARKDEKVILLTGDLGYNFIEEFMEEFPDRFINCGIAEQNMVGVAAGLARTGWKPYVYSGAMFLCTRALEQIRDDICYSNLNVTLVGTGAAGFLGFSHNFEGEEMAENHLRNLPNLDIRYDSSDLTSIGPMFILL